MLYYNRKKGGVGLPIKSDAQRRAVAKYNRDNYDQIQVRVVKGKREVIQKHAEGTGEKVNVFINRAIDEAIERDNKKAAGD